MKLKKIKGPIKTGWKWAKRIYLTSFLAASLYVGYDFCTSNLSRINRGETVQYLQSREYHVKIGEKEKKLTLVGEIHFYNKAENTTAKKLIDEHESFANEKGEGTDLSMGNFIYEGLFFIPISVNGLFFKVGSGRFYDPISKIAKNNGHKVYALEKDPFIHLSPKEKATILCESVFEMLVAPLSYYTGKNEKPYSASKFVDHKYKESMITKRDKVMARNLANLLNRNDVNNMLATVGAAHLEGVIRNLSEEVELKEVKTN